MTYDEAHEQIKFANSYDRFDAIYELLDLVDSEDLAWSDWLRVLGEEWSGIDDVGVHIQTLREVLVDSRTRREMMTAEEWTALQAMKQSFLVYRGCGPENMDGICWTTDKALAARFPLLHRYQQSDPRVITGRVYKSRVIAYKTDRKESEIISFDVKRLRVESIPSHGDIVFPSSGRDF